VGGNLIPDHASWLRKMIVEGKAFLQRLSHSTIVLCDQLRKMCSENYFFLINTKIMFTSYLDFSTLNFSRFYLNIIEHAGHIILETKA
jgi:hypothetical protein